MEARFLFHLQPSGMEGILSSRASIIGLKKKPAAVDTRQRIGTLPLSTGSGALLATFTQLDSGGDCGVMQGISCRHR